MYTTKISKPYPFVYCHQLRQIFSINFFQNTYITFPFFLSSFSFIPSCSPCTPSPSSHPALPPLQLATAHHYSHHPASTRRRDHCCILPPSALAAVSLSSVLPSTSWWVVGGEVERAQVGDGENGRRDGIDGRIRMGQTGLFPPLIAGKWSIVA